MTKKLVKREKRGKEEYSSPPFLFALVNSKTLNRGNHLVVIHLKHVGSLCVLITLLCRMLHQIRPLFREQGMDKLQGDTCFHVCPYNWLN